MNNNSSYWSKLPSTFVPVKKMSDAFEEFGFPINSPRPTVSLESRVEELARAFNELRANVSRADELAQCRENIAQQNQTIAQQNQTIAQQAQEIAQLRALVTQQNQTIAQLAQENTQLRTYVTQHQQWLQANARPLTQAYDFVKSDIDAYTHAVQRILDKTDRVNGLSIPSVEFNKRVQALGMACNPPISISSQKIHKIMATLGYPLQRGTNNVGYYHGLSWK
jgi:DNA repair exonuclease SbcCD ATPase subunit